MVRDDTVVLKNVEIGIESASGKAVKVKADGEWKWIPLSVVHSMHRNPRVCGEDSIVIARWFAEQEELA